jgi:hypothetical protein
MRMMFGFFLVALLVPAVALFAMSVLPAEGKSGLNMGVKPFIRSPTC